MKKIVRLTESDLTRIVKLVINEDVDSLKGDARRILMRLGYSPTLLKDYTKEELAKALRRENKKRFSVHDEWENLADKLSK
jgi:hypothetical protein